MAINNLKIDATKNTIFDNVLLVEDDKLFSHIVTYSLKKRNYNVVLATTCEDAFKFFMRTRFDACLIDVNLNGNHTGLQLTKKIRSKNPFLPIILMSSDDCLNTKLAGFDAGADDYVTKPINPLELIGRINLLKKRLVASPDLYAKSFRIGNMDFDYTNLQLKFDWINFRLTGLEAMLLRYLCLNPNQLIRREELMLKIWGKTDPFINRSMDVYISRLRKYLKSQDSVSIETIRGVGVKFNMKINWLPPVVEIPVKMSV